MVKHPQRLGPLVALAQLGQALTQLYRELAPCLSAAQLLGNGLHLGGQLFKAVGFCDVHRDIQPLELLALGRADAARPQQDQVGLEAEQALHVQLAVVPDRGHLRQRRRAVTTVKHADQQVLGTQLKHDFGQ